MSKRILKNPCKCSDPGCHFCHGNCPRAAVTNVVRIDMEDETGTQVCRACAEDCFESGLFRESRRNFHRNKK